HGTVSERETASPARPARMQASSAACVMPLRAYRIPLGFRVRSPLRSLTPPCRNPSCPLSPPWERGLWGEKTTDKGSIRWAANVTRIGEEKAADGRDDRSATSAGRNCLAKSSRDVHDDDR